jgi:phage N-6-adenine-methyltransferase
MSNLIEGPGAMVEWYTPPSFFDPLHKEFGFTLDVCATPESAKVQRYFTKEQDGLRQDWSGVCWMNPPYGREIGSWMRKAYESSQGGATVVCLVPVRSDTRWWHDWVEGKAELRFVKGRIKFINGLTGKADDTPKFPSVVVIYRPEVKS